MWLFFYFVMFFRYAPACIECFLQVFLPILLAILSFSLFGKSGQLNQHYGHPLRGCLAIAEITMTFFIVLFLENSDLSVYTSNPYRHAAYVQESRNSGSCPC